MKIVGATLAILIAIADGQGATERLALRVTPSVSSAPSTVTIKAKVEKNPANRFLGIQVDSGTFYRSSEIELDGERAPLMSEFEVKDLPSGEYTVAALLRDSMGQETVVRRTVVVLSRTAEPPLR